MESPIGQVKGCVIRDLVKNRANEEDLPSASQFFLAFLIKFPSFWPELRAFIERQNDIAMFKNSGGPSM